MKKTISGSVTLLCFCMFVLSCKDVKKDKVTGESANNLDLKRGNIVSCGPADKQFGIVGFQTSCNQQTAKDFELGIALLHSFEYDESEKAFAKVIDQSPDCAMAYWGVAMANYHPLWTAPTVPELEKGAKAIAHAQSLSTPTAIEKDFIDAIALFYKDWKNNDHRSRSVAFSNAMEKIQGQYPDNKEAKLFYALSLIATADPADKTFANQQKAGSILERLYPEGQNHPGIVHYIIHTYDSPELATMGLSAARKYASIAPSSAHAQHMPSHIFTRLGHWDESIQSNSQAATSAQCYAESAGIKGHWDEELHALDYLTYAYLQKGDNDQAKQQWDYLASMKEVSPVNFKVYYAFASIPSRYLLENKLWKDAAGLEVKPANLDWEKSPWQKAIIHFTRALGAANTGQLDAAKTELKILQTLRDTLAQQGDAYKANQVDIQLKASEAWVLFKEGKNSEALKRMELAADMEDKTEKHPVTPGEVLPARELLGDMLQAMNKPAEALAAYEANLVKHPNRFNGLYGAAVASEKLNNAEKANRYYNQIVTIANSPGKKRPEFERAKLYLEKSNARR